MPTRIGFPTNFSHWCNCKMFGYYNRCLALIYTKPIRSSMLIYLVITIPISLLWNVRIKTRQKLGIGAFLCLSVVMIIVAIIKASGIRTSVDSFNLVWELFWQQIEACAAVLMVSFTAFRSIFLSKKQQKLDRNNGRPGIFQRLHTWLSAKEAFRGDVKHPSPSAQVEQAPPHVTLGTSFQSVQRKGLLGSQLQPVSQSGSSHSQDPESGGLEEGEPRDLENLVTRDRRIESSSADTESGAREHRPGNHTLPFSSSRSTKPPPRGHWWQMGLISNFTLSRSKGPDSEF